MKKICPQKVQIKKLTQACNPKAYGSRVLANQGAHRGYSQAVIIKTFVVVPTSTTSKGVVSRRRDLSWT